MNKRTIKKIESQFDPSTPVLRKKYLFGRNNELKKIRNRINSSAYQLIISGDRGIGKTSLSIVGVNQLNFFEKKVIRIYKCSEDSSFNDILAGLTTKSGFDTQEFQNKEHYEIRSKLKSLASDVGARMKNITFSKPLLEHIATPDRFANHFKKRNTFLLLMNSTEFFLMIQKERL